MRIEKIKKLCIGILTGAALIGSALPVWANQTLTDTDPLGDTTVTANVSNGDVTYIISIPDTINFGRLTQPTDNTSPHMAEVGYTVGAIQIEGMDTKTSRVAVLMKDSTAGRKFQITGQDTANAGKTLSYSVMEGENAATDISAGTWFTNGYLLAAFGKENESIAGSLQLDQNQLYGVNMSSWAGKYQGTINFFSKIASIDEFN